MRNQMASLLVAVAVGGCGSGVEEDLEQRQDAFSWDHVLGRITASDPVQIDLVNNAQSTWHGTLTEDGRPHDLYEMEEPLVLPTSQINPIYFQCPSCLVNNTFSATNTRHAPLQSLLVTGDPSCDAGTCLSFFSHWPWSLSQSVRNKEFNDRVEVVVTDQLTINQWSYFRFFVKLGTETEAMPAKRDTLLSQIWQIHSPSPWRLPIFHANLKGDPTNGFYIEFVYRNNDGGAAIPVAADGSTKSWITPGVWASFHFALKPVPLPAAGQPMPAPGAIHIFRDRGLSFVPGNGAVPINQGHTSHYWGYRPANNQQSPLCANVESCVSTKAHVRVGIYRNEASFGPALPKLAFKMDSIKITTHEAYMPGY